MSIKVILVPYRAEHVEKYHKWMSSSELQELTGSEPLSLEEEFEMQKTWKEDKDKCTFIVLHKETFNETGNEVEAMVGDTNLFLSEDSTAEAEIMIADTRHRGKGLGWESMLLMLRFGVEKLGIKMFEAKIKMSNTASIKMFQKIGFEEVSRSDAFKEITMSLNVNKDFCEWLQARCSWDIKSYNHC